MRNAKCQHPLIYYLVRLARDMARTEVFLMLIFVSKRYLGVKG